MPPSRWPRGFRIIECCITWTSCLITNMPVAVPFRRTGYFRHYGGGGGFTCVQKLNCMFARIQELQLSGEWSLWGLFSVFLLLACSMAIDLYIFVGVRYYENTFVIHSFSHSLNFSFNHWYLSLFQRCMSRYWLSFIIIFFLHVYLSPVSIHYFYTETFSPSVSAHLSCPSLSFVHKSRRDKYEQGITDTKDWLIFYLFLELEG